MASSQDPLRPRPAVPPDVEDATYQLAGDEPSDVEEEGGEDETAPEPAPKPAPAVKPLPRMWKAAPDPEPRPSSPSATPATPSKSKPAPSSKRKPGPALDPLPRGGPATPLRSKESPPAKRKPKPRDDDEPGERKGALVEETPLFETVETRQTVRIILGSIFGLICLIVGFLIYRSVSPSAPPDIESQTNAIAPAPAPTASPEQLETEAGYLFERAREVARTGKIDLAVSVLNRLVTSYPKTAAAAEAREALERPSRNLPLFVDRPIVVATTPEKTQPATAPTVTEPPPPMAPPEATTPPTAQADVRPTQSLPSGFQAAPGSGVHASGWPLEIVCERDEAPMVLVPGGSFLMGRDDGEASERPAHRVTLSTYYIDQHEVTVRQFDLFLLFLLQKKAEGYPERARALSKATASSVHSEDAPVVLVTAREAKDYADWTHKRLPTEAQWEFAARGTENRTFPWGSAPPRWSRKREPRQIDPVRSFPEDVSPFGAFDLAGNACEWTKDWYDSKYYQLVRGQTVQDPVGPSKPPSLQLVVKGCSKTWEVSRREGLRVDTRLPFLGFRCVLPVEGPDRIFRPSGATANTPGEASPSAPAGSVNGFVPF